MKYSPRASWSCSVMTVLNKTWPLNLGRYGYQFGRCLAPFSVYNCCALCILALLVVVTSGEIVLFLSTNANSKILSRISVLRMLVSTINNEICETKKGIYLEESLTSAWNDLWVKSILLHFY